MSFGVRITPGLRLVRGYARFIVLHLPTSGPVEVGIDDIVVSRRPGAGG
jgi:hypothetical protein